MTKIWHWSHWTAHNAHPASWLVRSSLSIHIVTTRVEAIHHLCYDEVAPHPTQQCLNSALNKWIPSLNVTGDQAYVQALRVCLTIHTLKCDIFLPSRGNSQRRFQNGSLKIGYAGDILSHFVWMYLILSQFIHIEQHFISPIRRKDVCVFAQSLEGGKYSPGFCIVICLSLCGVAIR